jgi:hypothetical protein
MVWDRYEILGTIADFVKKILMITLGDEEMAS